MTSVQFDGTELQNTTYIPRTVQHESAPQRLLDLIKLARQDGSVIVDDTFGEKYITIPGILKGTSLSDLETKIDAFKELISRKDKNLDISFAGGTRRYVCRSVSHEFNRDFYHLLYVPYTVKFFVVGSIGKDTSETTPLNATGITATSDDRSVSFAGSYKPKPRHKITITTRGNADTVRIANQDTGDYMEVDLDGFVNGDYFEIDEENQTVKKNGSTNIEYRGKFPSVVIGSNNLRMTVTGSGYTLDQQSTDLTGGSTSVIYSNTSNRDPVEYQSFVAQKSGRVKKLSLYIGKQGAPGGNALFALHADNNGVPGTQLSGGNWQTAMSGLSTTPGYVDILVTGTAPFVVAGRRYWIRNFTITGISGSDISNFMRWGYSENPSSLVNGKMVAQKNSNSPFIDGYGDASVANGYGLMQGDHAFQEFVGDGGAASHTIAWRIDYTKKYL